MFDGNLQEEIPNGPDVDIAHILNVVTGGQERVAQ